MSIPSLYGPRFNSHAYSEKIPGFMKEVFTGKKEPLNVLYIQGLDEHYHQTKKISREHFDERVSSGEIKIKHLEGASSEEKLKALANTIMELRNSGRINNGTQIILSCKPGEKAGELDIGSDGISNVWQVKDVINAIRGGKTEGQFVTSSKFAGAIHIFGHSHEEFKPEDKKGFGNVLMHASGKFNWSHHHAFMIGHIVKASQNTKEGTPEEITKRVRDAIQPYAGYPIYRITPSEGGVRVKYPTFKLNDEGSGDRYINLIKNHKQPIDMLISSLERDTAETFRKRLMGGGLMRLLKKNSGDIGSYEKKRLLAALVSSKVDQDKKLKILTEEINLKIDIVDVKSKLEVGPTLHNEIIRNRDRLEPGLLVFLEKLQFEIVPESQVVNFLVRKISDGKLPELIKNFPKIVNRMREMNCTDVHRLAVAAFAAPDAKANIGLLWSCGLKFSTLMEDQLQGLMEHFNVNPPEYVRLIDALFDAGAPLIVNTLNKSQKFSYNFLSKNPENQEKIKDKLVMGINDGEDYVSELVKEAVNAAAGYNDLKPIKFLIECGLPVDFVVADEKTVLQFALNTKPISAELVDFLCKKGANVKNKNSKEMSAIDFLEIDTQTDLQKMEKILRILIEKDESILDDPDKYHLRPIHYAAFFPNRIFIEALLKIRPKYVNNVCDNENVTPLHVAIAGADERRKEGSLNKQEFLRVVDILLENNANLDAEDSNGNTPKDYMSGLKGFEQINLEDRQSELVQKKIFWLYDRLD